ncbi:MAG: GTPase, partial [Thermodesulfobacteriota bacterium]
RAYYPGEINLRRAHAVVINKARSAGEAAVTAFEKSVGDINPEASIIRTAFTVIVEGGEKLPGGKKVLVIEDGPTLTHGGMGFGAGIAASRRYGWVPVDPRAYAKGSIKDTFDKYPRIRNLLPALGYSEAQVRDLTETIKAAPCDAVLVATPVDLKKIINMDKEVLRVTYEIEDFEEPGLKTLINEFVKNRVKEGP